MQVEDSLGKLLRKWTRRSPRARWRVPLWAGLCLLVCSSFVVASVGITAEYGTLWFAVALGSFVAYTALGIQLLLGTRHCEYRLYEHGLKLRYFWSASDQGSPTSYWWEEFAGVDFKDTCAVLGRKDNRSVVVRWGPSEGDVREIIAARIQGKG
jgi:hypothetical protein